MLLNRLDQAITARQNVEVVLCPSIVGLQSLSLQVNRRKFKLGAQNCYWRDEGAFTGEVSAMQLTGIADYVIIGHSERRYVFGESEKDIRNKVQAVFRNRMVPILCVGETASQRSNSEVKHTIHEQLISGLSNVTSEEISQIVISYEPVWAIGTGRNAPAQDVEYVAELIHSQVKSLYGAKAADEMRILYGGSTDDRNADQYLSIDRIDGLLVGGASLQAPVFAKMVEVAHNKRKDKQ